MPAARRKDLLASRRRRQDDGEEDDSVLGDLEDDSMSEGSALSNGDDDDAENGGGNSSGEEHDPAKTPSNTTKPAGRQAEEGDVHISSTHGSLSPEGPSQLTADTDAILHGLAEAPKSQEPEEFRFEDLATSTEDGAVTASEVVVPRPPRHETPSQRSRREHQEYIKQRNANPAFVPTRGGFFLHDDRSSRHSGPNQRPYVRGRGRGVATPMHAGRGSSLNEPTDKPWAHDLHEDHETALKAGPPQTKKESQSEKRQARTPPVSAAPNRFFSFSMVLGNVTVQISFPGISQKISIPNVVKKQHTLLPQHRPPLRRDKPVRISMPGTAPRYIFPSTERSFIFIPRALRPNQQSYRGRGRGSFQGSRRPSIYGSVYTPSIAMSRKSSLGASTMRDGIRSPTDSILSRMAVPGTESTRPVVRMPSTVPTPSLSRTGIPGMNGDMGVSAQLPQVQTSTLYGSHSTAIPMHQPRPQKAVSVADIESPASFQFKAPQPQQEQPFHQQVPAHIANAYADEKANQPGQQSVPAMAGVTPLSQIPEGAVFGQGFQPYPVIGAPAYFGAPYNAGTVYYPPMADTTSFGLPMSAPSLAPSFVPGSHSHPVAYMPAPSALEASLPPNPVIHESNGMVFYYNPPMFAPDAPGRLQPLPVASNGNVATMTNGTSGQTPFYFSSAPTGMFYPAQSG
ncbi:hypothetical protein A1O3_05674 [Capronia epimyces CBS 606.96]|uniref:Btz domain-containing protein n=1 Tax=Capronia epimyces CBS 606.96 TaxID=1182542 RepID=W9YRU1_9EURO|nr:uncharacterized protein A1O3_05674 [Capronia epimyces CBS 606.96]EXJ84999.1 hypothetical protein A1O3_05674 [Capronia epimyces CBS 606.96]